ncbi:TadE/TadG family type IV pilus assembly protein [Yoonia sp. R2-816]|uniref:TadE/TadG family type IV pilus assembly protein n=1 Tax=Yoonia sp. R2-816 TaxID=3342638 RepID=UPI00372C03D3
MNWPLTLRLGCVNTRLTYLFFYVFLLRGPLISRRLATILPHCHSTFDATTLKREKGQNMPQAESRSWVSRFAKCEDGSATVESLFWFPLFMFILVLVADVSFIFFGKAQALRVIQDGNRALSVGRFNDTESTQDFIAVALQPFSENVVVTTTVQDGVVTSTAKIPTTDLMAVGSIPGINNIDVVVTAQHFLEQ